MNITEFKPFHLKKVKIKRVSRENKLDGACYIGKLVKICFGRNKICLSHPSTNSKYWLGKKGKPRWFNPEDIQSIEEIK